MQMHCSISCFSLALKFIMLRLLAKCSFSTKSALNSDFKPFLSKYKESLNQILSSLNTSNSLEKIGVKLGGNKNDALLSELGTINVIDSQKAELTTFDLQVQDLYQYSLLMYLNFS